jgi:ATP-dependent DNA helicase DinG
VLNHEALSPRAALNALTNSAHFLCHAGFLTARLAQAADAKPEVARAALNQRHLDVAELFAFVCPAQTAVPTPKGMARALRVDADDEGEVLKAVAEALLQRLENPRQALIRETAEQATFLARANWPWAPYVMKALLKANPKLDVGTFASGLNVWDRLDEWEELGPPAKGDHQEVLPQEALAVLRAALGTASEARPQQRD